jgi:hypothetical protein
VHGRVRAAHRYLSGGTGVVGDRHRVREPAGQHMDAPLHLVIAVVCVACPAAVGPLAVRQYAKQVRAGRARVYASTAPQARPETAERQPAVSWEPGGEPSSAGVRLHRACYTVRFRWSDRHQATASYISRRQDSRSHRGGPSHRQVVRPAALPDQRRGDHGPDRHHRAPVIKHLDDLAARG